MSYCGGLLNVGIYNNNGGVEQLDLGTSTIVNTLTQASLGQGRFQMLHVMIQQTHSTLHSMKMKNQ